MSDRWLRGFACMGLLGCQLLLGCDVYHELPPSPTSGTGGKAGGSAGSGGTPDPCVPSEEICNGVDDNCNGVADEDETLADEDCSRRYHAKVECGRGGFCLFVPANPMCDPGYYHCDGLPETGCESTIPCVCSNCGDGAALDDAGADDAG